MLCRLLKKKGKKLPPMFTGAMLGIKSVIFPRTHFAITKAKAVTVVLVRGKKHSAIQRKLS